MRETDLRPVRDGSATTKTAPDARRVKVFLWVLLGLALAGLGVGGYLLLSEDSEDGSYPTRRIDPATVKGAEQAIGTALGLGTDLASPLIVPARRAGTTRGACVSLARKAAAAGCRG